MANRRSVCVGLMSGTSADGVDAAVVAFEDAEGVDFEVLGFSTTPYPADLRNEILAVSDARTGTVDRVCRLDAVLGEWFARAALDAIDRAGLAPDQVAAIGSHGQTVHHLPTNTAAFGVTVRSSLQIGDAAVIAERTGIRTVSDFRSRDIAAGGEGAPLVPIVDYLLFRSSTEGRVLVNIGGIANVTCLPAGCGPDGVLAFDTGPGNVIVDGLVVRMTQGRHAFDAEGEIARSGRVLPDLLAEWMRHPFLEQPPPRSTGREMFGGAHVDRIFEDHPATDVRDLVATATAFTAASIVDGLKGFAPAFDGIRTVYVSGGGSLNPVLMDEIRMRCGEGIDVRTTDDLGLASDAKEAVAFALLAHRTLGGLPGNLPSATGAARAVVLGHVTPGRSG